MVKRCLSDLNGDFLHVHRNNNKSGIITNLLHGGGNCNKLKSGKISDVYTHLTQHKQHCSHCRNKIINMTGGNINMTGGNINKQIKQLNDFEMFNQQMKGGKHHTRKKIYVENKDICFVGTRVKLVNPNIVSIAGKKVAFHYKTIVRKCNKHEHKIKHNK